MAGSFHHDQSAASASGPPLFARKAYGCFVGVVALLREQPIGLLSLYDVEPDLLAAVPRWTGSDSTGPRMQARVALHGMCARTGVPCRPMERRAATPGRQRSAFAAAVFSLLFPGLGHAYLGQWSRALVWAAAPILVVALVGGMVATPATRERVYEFVLTDTGLNGAGLNGTGLNGHGSNGHEPARAGGDSPIFKSMRSGFLTGNADEIHETEVDRGWEIAAQAVVDTPPLAEPAVAASTVTGLPRRAPGERLVPGSVSAPTAGRTRDPEAIRRRLQAHTAGVSRGRKAAQSSTQHTEAGPA